MAKLTLFNEWTKEYNRRRYLEHEPVEALHQREEHLAHNILTIGESVSAMLAQREGYLEDDLSAVSMQPDSWGQYAETDPVLVSMATRKTQTSRIRRTGKLIKDSAERLAIKFPFGLGASITFTMTSSPQADRQRVFELARLQVMAFFYWITYQRGGRRGGYWPGTFSPLLESVRSDWGNPTHQAFMKSVAGWAPCVLASGADGFFKIAIRR